MRDQHQRAGVAFQPALQPDHRIEIQVVGRFVEQQQVGTAHQRLRQVETHAPAAGKVAHRALQLFVGEAEAVQQAGGAGTDGPSVDGVQLTVQGGDGVAVVAVVGGLQFGFELAKLAVAVDNILDRRHVQRRRLLVDPGQRPVAGEGKAAAIRRDLALQQRQQRGFAAAIFAHQADLLTWINRRRGVVQQDADAASDL